MRCSEHCKPGNRSKISTRSDRIQLKLTRLLPATPEEAFDMWLDPDSVMQWMRPSEARMVYAELHPVVGGTFRFELRENDGRTFVHQGQYLEILRPRKLRFTWQSTVLGDRLSQVTVEFYEQAGQCLLVLVHDLPEDDTLFQDHRRGWALILDRFSEAYRIQRR